MKSLLLPLLVLGIVTGAACGSNSDSSEFPGPTGDDGDASIPNNPPPNFTGGQDGSITPVPVTLTITPLAPTVTVVTGQALPTVPFAAQVNGQAAAVAWALDRGELGAIDANGVFTPRGTIAGTGNITAIYGATTATTTITVNIQTTDIGDPGWTATPAPPGAGGYGGVGGDGPGAPASPGQVTTLNGTPTADSAVTFLYPYDKTVWPQGLLAPLLQWNAGAHAFDSVYVHIQEKNYEYKGYFAANKTPFANMPIPKAAWDAMAFSNAGEPVTVSLVFGQGTSAFGPYTETWKVAPANLQGTIYYNSYGTQLVKNSATDGLDSYGHQYGAGTLAIAAGATAPTLAAGASSVNAGGDGTGCRVCHTVSGDGQSLVTQASTASAGDYSRSVFVNLAKDTTAGAGTSLATVNLAFPAVSKDGKLLLSSSGGPINDDTSSKLYSLPAGTPVTGVTGLPAGFKAALPAFSPDGKHVSFNFAAGSMTTTGGTPLNADTVSLAVVDFDGSKTFSNPRVLYTPPGAANREPSVTYSSFLPDGSGVVFELEKSKPSGNWGFTWSGNTAELWWVDMATATPHRLDALNGYDAAGNIYLPDNSAGKKTHTKAEDVTLNYEVTVNPIVSGGYAWVVFTSRRMYGNVAELTPWQSDPRKYPWLDQVTDKKLWVAAIDLNAPPGTDPSHPAFYLPAQELYAGNARGYWSVDACRADGQTCQAGDQCCGGYCQPSDGGLVCSATKPVCAAQYDKCTVDTDCCGVSQGIKCINNVCSVASPPK